ncbi:MAG: DmsC/YnfH family molybdoenzyme membrane anchor subunit [Gordonibacter sp.]|uniref:dimethyl sulfoxide reductase anchor subunit family protein n=1 Tax=Gordonibacter sp. TaxID=1968902 RepID=UPI002FC9B848
MTSGFDELSLALFTALAPAGAVAFIVVALARLGAASREEAVRIDRMCACPFSVCLVGFIASATHLGTPANALHVFWGIGRSPLSNEVLSAVAFLFLVGAYWMMAFKRNFPDKIAKPWLVLTCAAAIVFIACTSVAYSVDTVPTWNTTFTPVNLLFSGLLPGPLLGLLFTGLAQAQRPLGDLLVVAVASFALVAGTIVLVAHQQSLALVANNEIVASSLVPHYPLAIAAHAALGITGITCAALTLRRGAKHHNVIVLRVLACVFALAAVFITRLVFYQLHMTVGF